MEGREERKGRRREMGRQEIKKAIKEIRRREE